MPQPTSTNVHVNRPLTNVSIAYIQQAEAFIASRMFPNISVNKQSDRYFKYTKDQWFSDQVKKRAPGSESAGGGYEIDNTPSYYCDVYSLHKDVADQIRNNADEPLDMDRDATLFVSQLHMLRKEKQFVSNFLNTSVWGSDYNIGVSSTKWNASGSDPVQDIEGRKNYVQSQSGFRPNAICITRDLYTTLKTHSVVRDRYKYTSSENITPQMLAALFEVEKFLIVDAIENTAKEGATAVMNYLKTNAMLLAYSNPNPSILQPSAGYVFQWVGMYGAGSPVAIKKFRMEHLESDRIEGSMAWDMKVVGSDLGCYIYNAI